MKEQRHPSNTTGFCGMLTILFIALKLMGYIDWNWLWVLAPMWVPIAMFIGVIIATIIKYRR